MLESLYEQRKEERRKELAKELKRRENYSRNRLTEKDQKRSKSNEHRNNSEDKKQNENSKLKRKKEKRGVEQHTSKDKNLLKGKEKVKIQENLVIKNKDAVVVLKSKEKIKVSKERIADQEEKLNEVIPEEAKTVVEKVVHKKVFDIEALPSTTDFVRFMSLDYSDDVASHNACWFPAQYQRVVIILIDALRYDFVALSQSQYNNSRKEYSGHFSTVTRLLDEQKGK
ncbi:unnamed protein product [Brugia timori]|uniref:Uncharacterized protein n=1 Tax=Brugia timori TaxID=42155 RepID=A0A3P7W2J7_9BILA|nr:unnamed protein product [Brugia timori]